MMHGWNPVTSDLQSLEAGEATDFFGHDPEESSGRVKLEPLDSAAYEVTAAICCMHSVICIDGHTLLCVPLIMDKQNSDTKRSLECSEKRKFSIAIYVNINTEKIG